MYRNNNYYPNQERFIGPLIPFVGGALIGYIAGRPNTFSGGYYQQPVVYYPYYQQVPYYQYYSQNTSNYYPIN